MNTEGYPSKIMIMNERLHSILCGTSQGALYVLSFDEVGEKFDFRLGFRVTEPFLTGLYPMIMDIA
jgi:hypothetical protein